MPQQNHVLGEPVLVSEFTRIELSDFKNIFATAFKQLKLTVENSIKPNSTGVPISSTDSLQPQVVEKHMTMSDRPHFVSAAPVCPQCQVSDRKYWMPPEFDYSWFSPFDDLLRELKTDYIGQIELSWASEALDIKTEEVLVDMYSDWAWDGKKKAEAAGDAAEMSFFHGLGMALGEDRWEVIDETWLLHGFAKKTYEDQERLWERLAVLQRKAGVY